MANFIVDQRKTLASILAKKDEDKNENKGNVIDLDQDETDDLVITPIVKAAEPVIK